MTYEERMSFFCEQICHDRLLQCGYINRNMMGDCTYLQNVMAGWEAGYQDALQELEEKHTQTSSSNDRSLHQ